ncbi:hypothetical protein [Streptomyces silvisoli]|uniref:hypothetical protein n=1 Tax=Streptomyces silvisoli TaxID=3034235 RepID=UPI0028BD29FB|nr:hypothetical protein [Streptomyces silvisoli]
MDPLVVQRLNEVSAVSLGLPHDFLREPGITRNVHGDRWADIIDRGATYRRTVGPVT